MTLLVVAETAHPGGLAGPERRLLDACLRSAGQDPAEVRHLGVLPCTRVKEVEAARPPIVAAVAEIAPTKILALGGTALAILRGVKKAAITKEHGLAEWVEYPGGRALMVGTVPPSMVLRQSSGGTANPREWMRDLLRDTRKVVQQDEPLPLPEPMVWQPKGPAELHDMLKMLERYEAVSCDLETEPGAEALADLRAREHTHEKAACRGCRSWEDDFPDAGTNPRTAHIMSLGIGTASGPCLVVRGPLLGRPDAQAALWRFLWERGAPVIFHNGKFDLQFLAMWFGMHAPAGVPGGDTMLLSFLLDERPVRSMYRAHGLKDISRYRYDIPDYAFDWPRFWSATDEERDWATLDHYHGLDLHQTARLWWDLRDEAEATDPGVLRVHDGLLWPASLALAEAELRGIRVDRAYLEAYRDRLDRRLDRRLRTIRAALGDREFNPGSAQEVEGVVFDDWGMEPVAYSGFKTTLGAKGQAFVRRNSRKEQLEKLAQEQADPRQARIMRMIVNWRHDSKARETYAVGLLRSAAQDGRAHSQFNLAGAATGRLSSSDPNLQNIPKRGPTADAIRRAFTAPEGWLMMEADYSQLELRVAALLSRDRRLAAVYREGRDIHREVASVMFHKPPEELSYMERYLAKAVDFGALYGRSGKAISQGAEMEYYEKKMGGRRWSGDEAQDFVNRFLGGFPDLKRWLEETAEAGVRDGRIETLFGRVRRFPLILRDDRGGIRRQSFNTPIQSVASDICLSALGRLAFGLDPDEARVVCTIHDSLMLEVRGDRVPQVAELVKAEMMAVPPEVAAANEGLGIPFEVDVKVGRSWCDADMHDAPGHPIDGYAYSGCECHWCGALR